MADETGAPKIIETTFTKIADNILGAEGPVFDKDGNFYMVAPEVEKEGSFAGQVLKVNLETCEVCHFIDIYFEESRDNECVTHFSSLSVI